MSATFHADTISRRESPDDANEYLTNYGRLLTWSRQAGLVSGKDEVRLRAAGAGRSRAAAATLKRAVAVREAIFALFVAVARRARAPAAAVEDLNLALPNALSALRIDSAGEGFGWRFVHDDDDLAPMLAPVVRAAAELATSAELTRIRECGSDRCFWLFLDRSKNGTRRWCDMKVCGNRAKARRHYAREKASAR
jgi:predicted RNA-binding Zn ribbon-like protein